VPPLEIIDSMLETSAKTGLSPDLLFSIGILVYCLLSFFVGILISAVLTVHFQAQK